MLKKLTLLAISVGALVAIAAPASASASAIITSGSGGAASALTAISQNLVLTTNFGTWDCDTWELTLTVTANTTETAHAEGDGRAEGTGGGVHEEGPCAVSAPTEVPITMEDIDFTLHLEDGGKGNAQFSFKYIINHILPCKFSGEATVGYNTEEVSFSGGLSGGPSPCFNAGSISGTFTELLDENGEPADLMG